MTFNPKSTYEVDFGLVKSKCLFDDAAPIEGGEAGAGRDRFKARGGENGWEGEFFEVHHDRDEGVGSRVNFQFENFG